MLGRSVPSQARGGYWQRSVSPGWGVGVCRFSLAVGQGCSRGLWGSLVCGLLIFKASSSVPSPSHMWNSPGVLFVPMAPLSLLTGHVRPAWAHLDSSGRSSHLDGPVLIRRAPLAVGWNSDPGCRPSAVDISGAPVCLPYLEAHTLHAHQSPLFLSCHNHFLLFLWPLTFVASVSLMLSSCLSPDIMLRYFSDTSVSILTSSPSSWSLKLLPTQKLSSEAESSPQTCMGLNFDRHIAAFYLIVYVCRMD